MNDWTTEAGIRAQWKKGLLKNHEMISGLQDLFIRKVMKSKGTISELSQKKKFYALEDELKKLNKKYPQFK